MYKNVCFDISWTCNFRVRIYLFMYFQKRLQLLQVFYAPTNLPRPYRLW